MSGGLREGTGGSVGAWEASTGLLCTPLGLPAPRRQRLLALLPAWMDLRWAHAVPVRWVGPHGPAFPLALAQGPALETLGKCLLTCRERGLCHSTRHGLSSTFWSIFS